jgi:ABC-2 type transport system ATP-binding protein
MLRGVEFVTLSGDLYGMPHQHARRRAHEVLNYVGLGELRYRRLEEYSTGNIQRLKLAAALVHDPELLLLDEPTNGLDPAGRQSMLELIKGLIAETGKSVVLCTHLLSDVERLCEQVVILHRGTAVMAGGPTAAGEERTNRYEAAWIGNGEAFLQGFQEAGGRTGPVNRLGRRMLTLPTDWTTREVFSLAQSRQAVITYLIPDEEDLEQMFFRVTDGHATASAAVRG